MYDDLLYRIAPTYLPVGYDTMASEQRAAWHAAHDALRTADAFARCAGVRLDRAHARSRTTPAHMAAVIAEVEATNAVRWAAYDALLALELEPPADVAA